MPYSLSWFDIFVQKRPTSFAPSSSLQHYHLLRCFQTRLDFFFLSLSLSLSLSFLVDFLQMFGQKKREDKSNLSET